MIIEDKRLSDKILVYLHQKTEEKIMVTFKNELDYEYISIENLKNFSAKRDSSKTYLYIVNLIKFIGNLCAGNNYMAINEFKNVYPFNTCVKIISNSVLGSEIKSAFAELLHKLWFMSGEKRKLTKSHFYCKVWDEIGPEREGAFKPEVQKTHTELWYFIKGYLEDTERLWSSKMYLKSDLGLLKDFLILTG